LPITADEFKSALSTRVAGVAIVTSRSGDAIHGMTATDWAGVSVDPALVVVSIAKTATTLAVIEQGKCFAINVLSVAQEDLANRFASEKDEDRRFEGVEIEQGSTGAPLLAGALTALDCSVVAAHEAGDHWLFVGRIEKVVLRGGDPLAYWGAGYRRLADPA
jgi:flavin reductase (DIM6/NTAB) family NADH-FMN oxidoreductase RutF